MYCEGIFFLLVQASDMFGELIRYWEGLRDLTLHDNRNAQCYTA